MIIVFEDNKFWAITELEFIMRTVVVRLVHYYIFAFLCISFYCLHTTRVLVNKKHVRQKKL